SGDSRCRGRAGSNGSVLALERVTMSSEDSTVWGIHAGKTGDADSLFLNKGNIALGWDQLGNLKELAPNREASKDAVSVTSHGYKPGAVPVAARQNFRFTHVLKPGDFVVYRSKVTSQIHIGRITGEYEYRPDIEPGYPHLRRTTWLTSIDPKKATQGALYELGSAMSLFQ